MAVAAALTASLLLPDPGPLPPLRFGSFDAYQYLFPRERRSRDAVVVEVDDKSLASEGQWPWPRDKVAQLIERIAARGPTLIAVDILFAEPDRASPERIAAAIRFRDPILATSLARMKSNDDILGEAIAAARVVVVGSVGISDAGTPGPPLAPSRVANPAPPLQRFAGVLRSLPQIDKAAVGRGLLNVEQERGIVRRVPLVAYVADSPALALAAESVRIASKAPFFAVGVDEQGLTRVGIGPREITTQPDGRVWLHFSPHDPGRFLSAGDVIAGRDDPAALRDKIVLVGVSAIALLDHHTNARGERMAGIEIHAQLIENILEGSTLRRPAWARFVEALGLALAAAAILLWAPRVRPRRSFQLLLAGAVLLIGIAAGAFWWGRVLIDAGTPLAGVIVLYGLVLSATLVAMDVERRNLAKNLRTQRDNALRVTGELQAAQRIQTGILPTRESALKQERRVDIFTHMKPAREVGGDLYDFFSLGDDKFFVMEGDVSGKGLPAAMFMAVSKAVTKSCALRGGAGVAGMMRAFNQEISRENPEQMFVTMVALIIDLRTGDIEYCNAGHEPPLLMRRTGEALVLDAGGGPPLCVVDDYDYEQARAQLEPRDVLVLASDGITEAMNPEGGIYGRARMKALVEAPGRRDLDLTILGNEILAAVKRFESGAEPTDDQTLLVLSWRGR